MAAATAPSTDVFEGPRAGRCLPVDEPALRADEYEAILRLRFVFAEEGVEDFVIPVCLCEGGCGYGRKLLY